MSIDLSTEYLGLKLRNPCVLAPSPLTASIDQMQRFADAGAAAAVLPSMFEDQLEQQKAETDALYECRTDVPTESLSYFQEMEEYNRGPDAYLRYVAEVRKRISIPVIASLGAVTPGDWSDFARSIQSAGADAIELNIYFVPHDPMLTARDVENRYREILADVSSSTSLPVSIKLGPYFTALANFAQHLEEDGARGLVLFNRYLEPDVDIETREVWPRLDLSRRGELRLALRWIAILREQRSLSLAATGGVHGTDDIIKSMLVGADAVMMASSLIEGGPERLSKQLDEFQDWLKGQGVDSVAAIKGVMRHARDASHADREERSNYLHALVSYANRWRAEHAS